MNMGIPLEIIPFHDILGHILHRVRQEEAVLMPVDTLVLPFFELDKVARVAEFQFSPVIRNL